MGLKAIGIVPIHLKSFRAPASGQLVLPQTATMVQNVVRQEDDNGQQEQAKAAVQETAGWEPWLPLDEIEVKKPGPNRRLVANYSYWFHDH